MGTSSKPFEPVARRRTLTDEIATVLRDRVLSGDLMAGDRLPSEQQLAESFEVSRPVIREAIARLKVDGLIDTKQGLGAFVAAGGRAPRFDAGGLDAKLRVPYVFELRWSIEPMIAAFAARRRTDRQLEVIAQKLETLRQSVRTGKGGSEADAAFHEAIAEAAGNPLFSSLMEFVQSTLRESLRISHTTIRKVAGGPAKVHREHIAIFNAIRDQDEAAARQAALDHLTRAAGRLSISLR
ncbi:MAG TPA: FadR/GntR family transcriptional regulator [Dongiaceae bacterium]|jgi:DNA-binding FadR family transcriptional regulator|nr:FadR/GntR family transcriptional regulator [Dongiaceae bacterium]